MNWLQNLLLEIAKESTHVPTSKVGEGEVELGILEDPMLRGMFAAMSSHHTRSVELREEIAKKGFALLGSYGIRGFKDVPEAARAELGAKEREATLVEQDADIIRRIFWHCMNVQWDAKAPNDYHRIGIRQEWKVVAFKEKEGEKTGILPFMNFGFVGQI